MAKAKAKSTTKKLAPKKRKQQKESKPQVKSNRTLSTTASNKNRRDNAVAGLQPYLQGIGREKRAQIEEYVRGLV